MIITNKFGYIYIRNHKSYLTTCKLGKTECLPNRDNIYATGELERGYFYPVFEVLLCQMNIIEKLLQFEFNKYNIKFDGGIEFYNKEIITLIEPFLQNNKIKYKKLSSIEIDELKRKYRIKNNIKNINKKKLIEELIKIKPLTHQINLLIIIKDFYNNNNNNARFCWSCGLGKALMSIFIVREMKFTKVVICVPNIYLQNQIETEILRIFPKKENILHLCGTNKNKIFQFINKNNDNCKFIISTYNSCYILTDDIFYFDFKIGDEAHHLVGIENEDIEKSFISFHKIKSKKTLFMTATEKIIENKIDKKCYSMDDEDIFGKLLDKKTVHWAIQNEKITDYFLLVLKNTEEEVNQIITTINIDVSNKELFISAYMVLKSIENYNNLTHVTIYTNKTENAELVKIYVDKILETNIIKINKIKFYNEALHSKTKNNLDNEVTKFKNTKYGIISCVYIFGEGFDLPKLNGVCFAENMDSEIRIVQCALRPNRLEKNNPHKKAYIIIPYIDYNDWNNDNKSFDKIRKIIGKLRNVDENIEQKIHILSKYKNKMIEKKEEYKITNDFYFEENENELFKLKLRLRHSKTLYSNFSEEQDEFNYIRQLNKELDINSKEDYIEKKLQHKMYIPQPDNYFCKKGVWTNWYDFIGYDTRQFIQSKQDWINFCKENKVSSIIDYENLCDKYKELPRNPSDFYTHFTNIQNELGLYNNYY
jgi:predicted helicase